MSRSDYYTYRGRVAQNCWTCDRNPCKCDAATIRAAKRGAKVRVRQEIADELADDD